MGQMLLSEFPSEALDDVVAEFPALLTDPELIASIIGAAAALREFSETPSTSGYEVYLPIGMR
jgi:hypothetical protein